MNKKDLLYGEELRTKLLNGVEKLSKAVIQTMGAKGRNVIMERPHRAPHVTNDGVTIAREIVLSDQWENLGAQTLKQAAIQTNEIAGDGTTCATLLGATLVKEAMAAIQDGNSPTDIRRGMDIAKENIVKTLKGIAKKVETEDEVKQVARISCQDEELGDLIGELMYQVGADGAVTLEDGHEEKVTYEKVDGIKMDSGFLACRMQFKDQAAATQQYKTIENARILVCKDSISNGVKAFAALADSMVKSGENKLVVLADDYAPEIVPMLMKFAEGNNIQLMLLRAPLFGQKRKDFFDDLGAVIGAKPYSKEEATYVEGVTIQDLPMVKSVRTSKHETIFTAPTLTAGGKELYESHKKGLEEQIENEDSSYNKELLKQRLANINGGIASIKISAPTETDAIEVRYRVEDAVNACKSAMEQGIVSGGGVALRDVAKKSIKLKGQKKGVEIGYVLVVNACIEPFNQILRNAGESASEYGTGPMITEEGFGFDVSGDELKSVNMIESGIIDPLKVISTALVNAVSVAGVLITTEAGIIDIPEEKKPM